MDCCLYILLVRRTDNLNQHGHDINQASPNRCVLSSNLSEEIKPIVIISYSAARDSQISRAHG
jgi:hypothetical protein